MFFFRQKKQNEKISHENEAKNWRPKGAPIVRGAKVVANYAEFGNECREKFEIKEETLKQWKPTSTQRIWQKLC